MPVPVRTSKKSNNAINEQHNMIKTFLYFWKVYLIGGTIITAFLSAGYQMLPTMEYALSLLWLTAVLSAFTTIVLSIDNNTR